MPVGEPAEAITGRSHCKLRPLPAEAIADGRRCQLRPAEVVARGKPPWTIAVADQSQRQQRSSQAEAGAGRSINTATRAGPLPLRPSPRVDGRSPTPPRAERDPPAVTGATPPPVLQIHPTDCSHLGGSHGRTGGARTEESRVTAPLLMADPSW